MGSFLWKLIPHSHEWEQCLCKLCNKPNTKLGDEYHLWDGCICKNCGKIRRDGEDYLHKWDGCVCSVCSKITGDEQRHSWSGCYCSKCKNYRHQYGEKCICNKCGMQLHVAEVIHQKISSASYLTRKCKRCGVILHSSTIKINSGEFSGGDTGKGPYYNFEFYTEDAQKIWNNMDREKKRLFLDSFWCPNCRKICAVTHSSGETANDKLIIRGNCEICGNEISRLV